MSEGLGFGRRKLINDIIKYNWEVDPSKKNYNFQEVLFVIQELLTQEGKPYFDKTVSRRGFRIFNDFVQHLLYRNIANYDSMLLITSEKGTGKSSAAIMLARAWCKLLGIRFSPQRHIAYNNADIMNKIDVLNPFEPIIADEAVRFASSEDWSKRENKELKKKLAQIRTKHLFFILCFPLKIYKLEKTYLESYVNYWCISGDTKILTRDINGMIRQTPIKDLNKRNPEVLSYNIKAKKYEFKKYEKKIKTKKNAEVFEVELENGLKIKATEDHLFLTQRGWVKLKDLKDSDSVEVKTNQCHYCNGDFVPEKQQQIYCSKKCNNAFNNSTEVARQYQKNFRKENPEKIREQQHLKYVKNRNNILVDAKKYRKENKDYINKWAEQYRKENIELLRFRDTQYRENNKERYLYLSRKNWRRYRQDINFKLRENLRNALRRVLKQQHKKKTYSIFEYLGCTVEEFKIYIYNQFENGMSWDNWSKDTWHIDHIKPCSHFDLKKESERYKCFNYKNQQPMWATYNLSKGDRYVG